MDLKQKVLNFFKLGSERSVKAKKNILAGFGIKGLSIIINLLYVPLLIDCFGSEEYGIWLTLTSIISWFGFFDVGLGNGLRNNFTIAVAQNDHELAKKYVSTTYAILSIIFIGVLLLFYFALPHIKFSNVFNTSAVAENELFWLSVIVFTFFVSRFVFQLITVILLADQRAAFSSLFNLLGNILSLVLILFVKYYTENSGSLVLLGTILSASPVIVLLIASIYFYNTKYKRYAPSIKHVDFKKSNILIGLGIKFFILQIADIIIYSTTNFLIAQFISPEEVTRYNIAYKMFSVVTMVYAIILTPMWSATTDAFAQNDFRWIRNTVKKIQKLGLLMTLFSFGLLLISDKVYFLWIGDRVTIPFNISFWVSIKTIMFLLTAVFVGFQNGVGKLKLTLYFVIAQAILYIPLAYFLAISLRLGISGILVAGVLVEVPIKAIQIIQYYKIINGNAIGIWNK